MLLVVCQLSRNVIGCEDCKTSLVCFDPSFVSQKSVAESIARVSRFVYCLSVLLLSSKSRLLGAGSCLKRFSGVCFKLVNQHFRVIR